MKIWFKILMLGFWSLLIVSCHKDVQVESELTLDPLSLNFTDEGGTQSVAITTTADWNITIPSGAEWCRVTPLSGSGSGSFVVTVDPSTTALQRDVTINVNFDGKEKFLPVTQAAGVPVGSYTEGEVRVYEINRPNKPVNMIFLGDGFIQADFTQGGAFDLAVAEAAEAIFNVEPYKTYREYFNIYKVAAFSAQRGATQTDRNIKKNTAFSTTYEGGSGMTTNDNKVFQYVQKVPGIELDKTSVILIVNDTRYAGTTMPYSTGRSVAICPMNRSLQLPGGFGHIVVHEAGGHGFGHLADEYTNEVKTPPTADEIKELKQWFGFGFYRNIDLTNDVNQVKWRDFIGRAGYDAVNVFEGANYHETGVWRPEYISCMDDNMYYFNAPSRAAIVQRLLTIAGESYTLAGFIAKDAVKAPPAVLVTRVTSTLPRLAPPVMKYTK